MNRVLSLHGTTESLRVEVQNFYRQDAWPDLLADHMAFMQALRGFLPDHLRI